MTNLFSIFDPVSCFSPWIENWTSMMFVFLFLPSPYFLIFTRNSNFLLNIKNMLLKEFFSSQSKKNLHAGMIYLSIFLIIVASNLLGLFPFIFTSTSHISMTFSLCLPFWISITVFWFKTTSLEAMAHLVPLGTPSILAPFMVIVESISLLIRPLTLAVRLSANMIAGHLLISLLSSYITELNFGALWFFGGLSLLLILESAVALIQAYVFVTLMSLYLNEV